MYSIGRGKTGTGKVLSQCQSQVSIHRTSAMAMEIWISKDPRIYKQASQHHTMHIIDEVEVLLVPCILDAQMLYDVSKRQLSTGIGSFLGAATPKPSIPL